MTKMSFMKRGLATLGVAGLLVAGSSSLASADVGPDQPDAPEQGTLTIHKYPGEPVAGASNDGTPITGSELDGRQLLGGVTFEIQRVGVIDGGACVELDLTDTDAWESVPTSGVPAFGTADGDLCAVGAPVPATTSDVEGSDDFGTVQTTLDVGLYYVEETDPGSNPIVEAAAPFYVTIPMPTVTDDPTENDWNYDVHVYPKNQLFDAPGKTITERPDDLTVGSNVTWHLSATVPTLNDTAFTEASITDTLNDRLDYVSSVVTVGGVVVYSDVDGVDFVDPGIVTRSGESIWTFTSDGLAFLDVNQGAEVVVELVTQVTGGEGEISNGGDDIDNPASFSFNETSVPTPLAYTYWGQLQITKVDESDTARTLAGAEFAVHELADGATECPAEPAGDAVSTGVSGEDGVVLWTQADGSEVSPANLWVANSNTELTDPAKDYCVYETLAPAGYTATGPELVEIVAGGLTSASDLVWENPQRDGPELPLTGAGGTVAMTFGGLLLVGLGIASVMLTMKRRRQATV